MFRQGDILLLPADAKRINLGANPRRTDIVARGEATGHAHRIVGDGWVANDTVVVVGPRGATLTHDEHAPIELREGVYAIRRQREFEDNGWREVYD